ncbi:hypothetical protein JW968_04150 [Candidatus Woesearchaeota archaeon]|nr:hypothetical protein [Candidatus Woesearchaeota archaeon]
MFEIISKEKIKDFRQIKEDFYTSFTFFLGILGLGKAGIWILPDKYDPKSQKGIIKVNHKYSDELKSCLCFITKIGSQEVIVRSIGLSGILNKAEALIRK